MRAPKSFEDGMTRLEAILEQMQQPETTLAESVKLYAEAASLMDYCNGTLEKATLQLDEIDAQRLPAGCRTLRRKFHGLREAVSKYLARANQALEKACETFCPRNLRSAGLPVTACWAAENASARCWFWPCAICSTAALKQPSSLRRRSRCCTAIL